VTYGDVQIATSFFADLIVEDRVIVEVKSIDAVGPGHKRQFNVVLIKDGLCGSPMERRISPAAA
jgi:GxxExxY protein